MEKGSCKVENGPLQIVCPLLSSPYKFLDAKTRTLKYPAGAL